MSLYSLAGFAICFFCIYLFYSDFKSIHMKNSLLQKFPRAFYPLTKYTILKHI